MVLKGIKHALGGGSADEHYATALEHLAVEGGGEERRSKAIRSFEKAAEKASDRPDFRARARANAALHKFIQVGNLSELRTVQSSMMEALWVERPGDPGERVAAEPLVAEIEGRLAAASATSQEQDAIAAHETAAAAFGRCGDHRLVTYPHHHSGDEHVATGRERHHYHLGVALTLKAQDQLLTDPDAASQTFGRALAAFAACGNKDRQDWCSAQLKSVQTRRTCWMCHREFPGEGMYYEQVSAFLTPYVRSHLDARGEDASSVDVSGGQLVLCRVCRSVVDGQARALLDARLPEIEARITESFENRLTDVVSQFRAQQ